MVACLIPNDQSLPRSSTLLRIRTQQCWRKFMNDTLIWKYPVKLTGVHAKSCHSQSATPQTRLRLYRAMPNVQECWQRHQTASTTCPAALHTACSSWQHHDIGTSGLQFLQRIPDQSLTTPSATTNQWTNYAT